MESPYIEAGHNLTEQNNSKLANELRKKEMETFRLAFKATFYVYLTAGSCRVNVFVGKIEFDANLPYHRIK